MLSRFTFTSPHLAIPRHSLRGRSLARARPALRGLGSGPSADAAPKTRVGIVGVGGVGNAIGLNLAKAGHNVVAFCDHNPAAGAGLEALGAERKATPRACAAECDVVITALTTPEVVRSCVLGEDGVFAGLRPGGLLLDHSTTDYNQTLEFAALAAGNGQHVLEAPITGGLTLLQEGKMTVLVGGSEALLQEHRGLLDASFANVLHMGDMGSATIAKVLSNMFAGAHVLLAGEALMVGKRANLDLGKLFDAIRLSAGNSYVWETEVPLILNQTFDPGFHIDLHCKDLNLGYEIARKFNVPLDAFGLVEQNYLRAMYKYGPTAGSTHPAKLIQDALGTKMDAPGFEDWSYTTQLVPSETADRPPTMAVVHQKDETKAANSKLGARPVDR